MVEKKKIVTIELVIVSIYNRTKKKEKCRRDYELKASATSTKSRLYLLNNLIKFNANFGAIIINKQNVKPELRSNTNLLYNYACRLLLVPQIKNYNDVTIIKDKRSIKVGSWNTFPDYIKIWLWYEENCFNDFSIRYSESQNCYGIQIVDYIAYAFSRKYEHNSLDDYNIIKNSGKIADEFLLYNKNSP